jgi:uncharacterized membrane protein YsdA (DUF1294 family)
MLSFPVPVVIYALANFLALGVFSFDKVSSKVRLRRIPEKMLLIVAVLGPFGALSAMALFRHKTRHVKFLLVLVFALLHLALIIWMWPQVAQLVSEMLMK